MPRAILYPSFVQELESHVDRVDSSRPVGRLELTAASIRENGAGQIHDVGESDVQQLGQIDWPEPKKPIVKGVGITHPRPNDQTPEPRIVDDVIVARLSAGEFEIDAEVLRKYGPELLHAINSSKTKLVRE